jgi:ribosomal protein S18 acetylase RimI-like enzyme
VIEIRRARPGDDRALATLDRATWSTLTSPAPAPPPEPDWTFFNERVDIRDVLIAELDGQVAGYVRLSHPFPIESSSHVLHISGIVVDPTLQRRGVGRALLQAAEAEARTRGVRRITLRVLAPNDAARSLYEACGYAVEGVQRGEFYLDGEYVDDVLMALDLTAGLS